MLSCTCPFQLVLSFFFFNDTATTEIYTLSLHDALPISGLLSRRGFLGLRAPAACAGRQGQGVLRKLQRSEEHTSELQSLTNLVCRLLLEKKKKHNKHTNLTHQTTESSNEHIEDVVHVQI